MTERTTNGILLAGRLILAGCLLPTAIARVLNPSGFAVTLATEGLPFATEVAAGAVVIGAVGPLALAVGVLPRATALVMAGHTLLTTLLLHRFWEFGGVFRQAEHAAFLADLTIVGAMLFYMQAGPGDWSWSGLRRRLFSEGGGAERKRPAPRGGGRALKAA
ncbi:DoxX family protein [Salinarimonas soli]|uniref:DoxX family protein n=1 Tax=Salinarimonas soli TaxID=1638099 RepID=A0A5B2VHN2_9HYPH|nr:DoxX family protein [Salinarimonas soli]KAA2238118.1 DoxX family protein [Salinarimonas soli]